MTSSGIAASAASLLAVGLALGAALTPGPDGDERGLATMDDSGVRLELGSPLDTSGFSRATGVREYRLPVDHGPHYGYQTEWWYYTGHLEAADGRAFGFQLTFFRRGLSPGPPPGGPGLSTNQIYFAHFAVTDVGRDRHVFSERWSRGAQELAGARGEPFAVWLENWRVESTNDDGSAVRLVAVDGPVRLELDLQARKPLARHGDRGLSPKSEEAGNASHYIGYTRLGARGQVTAHEEGEAVAVSGEAWFDHEWSTSALGAAAVGWDWFSLQLDDQRELLYFQIRTADGGIEAVSGGTLVDREGRTRQLPATAFSLAVLARWTSPGATYPARWRLRVPGAGLDLVVEPRVAAQEMRTSFTYWEGAVRVSGTGDGGPLEGRGYVELTGYSGSMQGVF